MIRFVSLSEKGEDIYKLVTENVDLVQTQI